MHHGNGTQAIFWDDPDTLYVSTHQSPLYPGTGHLQERGIKGNILNRPLPPGTGSAAWRRVVERDVLPAIDRWRPQLVLISAGFDAHMDDPLASMALVEDDFAWVTRELCGSPTAMPRGVLSPCSRAAMTRRRWRAASWRTCRC